MFSSRGGCSGGMVSNGVRGSGVVDSVGGGGKIDSMEGGGKVDSMGCRGKLNLIGGGINHCHLHNMYVATYFVLPYLKLIQLFD